MALSPTDGQSGVVGMAAGSDELVGKVAVNFLYWYSKGATPGDDLSVTDSADVVIWKCVADVANFQMIFPLKQVRNGIKIATIDSGTLYVIKASTKGGDYAL